MSELAQQAKKMDIALKYTGGDMELAKQMVAGNYQDIYIIKGKADIGQGLSSLFIINVFSRAQTIMTAYALASMDRGAQKTKAFLPIAQFAKEMIRITKDEKVDAEGTQGIIKAFRSNLQPGTVANIVKACDRKNLDEVSRMFQTFFRTGLKTEKVSVQLDIEPLSSFLWEYSNITEGVLSDVDLTPKPTEEVDLPEEENFMESMEVKSFESRYDRVVETSVVLSPVKGISLNALQAGDKIKIILPSETSEDRDFARARQAFNKDDAIIPITATYRKHIALPENEGFLIYADLPGKVLCRSFEESKIKVGLAEIPERLKQTGPKSKSGSKSAPLIMAGAIGLVVLIIIIAALS